MIKRSIKFNDFSSITDLVKRASKLSCEIEVMHDRYVVDAKSIMGIFSLNLSKPVGIVIHSEETAEVLEFLNSISELILE